MKAPTVENTANKFLINGGLKDMGSSSA